MSVLEYLDRFMCTRQVKEISEVTGVLLLHFWGTFSHGEEKKMTKVWVVMGYSNKLLTISYSSRPSIEIFDERGRKEKIPEVVFESQRAKLVYPVMAEVYVKEILTREEFRKICDTNRTPRKILEVLK